MIAVSGAHAQTGVGGTISIGRLTQETSNTGYLFGDFALHGAHGPWQARIGMFGVVGRLHETYADISYDAVTIQTSIGFPRPAYDLVAGSALTKIMPRLALESIGSSRSRATYGTMFEPKYLPYGVVVVGQAGPLKYAASLHGVPDYDTLIAGSGVSYRQGDWRYDLGIEVVNQNDELTWNTKAKLQLDQGRLALAAGVFLPRANEQPDVLELSVAYDLNGQVQVSGMTRHFDSGDATLAIGSKVTMSDAFGVEIGAALTDRKDIAVSAAIIFDF